MRKIHKHKTYWIVLVFAIFLAGLAGGYMWYATRSVSEANVSAIISRCGTIASDAAYIHCLRSGFAGIVRPDTLEQIVVAISHVTSIDASVAGGQSRVACHEIGHIVGEQAARTKGPLPLLVHACGTSCGYGCIHGLLVELSHTHPQIFTHPDGICVSVPGYPMSQLDKNNCNHGLGHALVENASYDIKTAISGCRGLTDDEAYTTCGIGAFMGTFDGYGRKNRPFELPDDLISYCRSVPAGAFTICINTLVAMKYGGDIHGGFTLCTRLGESDQTQCAIAMGTTLYFSEKGEAHAIANTCQTEQPFTRQCIQGAVESAVNMDLSGAHGRGICAAVDLQYQRFCDEFLAQTMKGWLNK